MHVFGQNFDFDTASTTMPSARSLSATMARGVGDPGRVPFVWSHGRNRYTRFGYVPFFSYSFRSSMNSLARYTSGMTSGKPGKLGCECPSRERMLGVAVTFTLLVPLTKSAYRSAHLASRGS